MINIPLGLPLRIIRKPAKPLAAAALSGEGGSFPLIADVRVVDEVGNGPRFDAQLTPSDSRRSDANWTMNQPIAHCEFTFRLSD